MGKALPLIILGALIVVAIAFLYLNNNQQNMENQMPDDKPVSQPTVVDVENAVPRDYEKFTNDQFEIIYHNEMEVRTNSQAPGNPVSFIMTGPSQTEGTELFDGINITVTMGMHEEASFEEFVRSEMQEIEDSGVSEVTSGITSVVISDNSGYEFTTAGLGEFRQIYFEGDRNQYAQVSVFVEDPEDQGFQNIADQMLRSFEF